MASVRKRKWTHKGVEKEAWVVSYTDQGGKRRIKTFDKKKDADRHRTKVETEIEKGEHVADRDSATVSAALDLWLSHMDERVRVRDRLRPRTVRSFRSWVENYIRPRLGAVRLTDLTFNRVQEWIDGLAFDKDRPCSFATISNTLVCLRLCVKHAHARGMVGRNVLRDFEYVIPGRQKTETNIPSKDEVRQLLAESGQGTTPGGVAPYLRTMLYVAVFAGLRQGEIRALEWHNVDFEKAVIRVRASADNLNYIDDPKTKAGIRDVPIAPVLMVELKKWKLSSGGSKGYVFKSRRGLIVQQTSIRESWCRLQYRIANPGGGGQSSPKAAKPKYKFHALRHVCASLLIESGLPPKRIQHIMGHSSIQMTFDRYGHLFEDPNVVNAALDKIGRDIAI